MFLVKGTGALCAGILVEPCFEGEAKLMLPEDSVRRHDKRCGVGRFDINEVLDGARWFFVARSVARSSSNSQTPSRRKIGIAQQALSLICVEDVMLADILP